MAETAAETHDGPEQEESRRDFLLISTIAVAQESGRLGEVLEEVGERLDQEIDHFRVGGWSGCR